MNGEEAILARLNDLSGRVERMDGRQQDESVETRQALTTLGETLTDLRVAVAGLKVKAGVWGAIAGVIPAALALFLVMVKLMLAGE